jgi:hypothetical protein
MDTKKKLSIIIPFRNRDEHLKIFLEMIKLKINVTNYDILIVEQDNDKPFNRAKLLNIGFDLKKDESDYFCFHDVDMIPEETDYSYVTQPTHGLSAIKHLGYKLSTNSYYGGVNFFNKEDFIKINGYSNEFWGWGGEDNDLLSRVKSKGFSLHRRLGKFDNLPHDRAPKNTLEYKKNVEKITNKYDYDSEGLNTLIYKVNKTIELEERVKKVYVDL